jgi:nucleoside-diphosphate-sugar epimerase
MPVLVTGAGGMLGGAIARRLAAAGLEVVATGRRTAQPTGGARWITTDLTRPQALADQGPFASVVHAAAEIPRSHADSDSEAAVNRQIDECVLAAARRWEAAVVYISSTAVYGVVRPPRGGVGEDQPLAPPGPYAEQKAAAEEAGREQARSIGRPFTALRVNAPYAPHQRSETVLRKFVERAVRGEPLLYWGTGAREQSFVHADDVAHACEAALASQGGTFNIADSRAVTMLELGQIVARAGGLPASVVQPAGQPDPGEDLRVAYRIERARELLGWRPVISLEQGVAEWIARVRTDP